MNLAPDVSATATAAGQSFRRTLTPTGMSTSLATLEAIAAMAATAAGPTLSLNGESP